MRGLYEKRGFCHEKIKKYYLTGSSSLYGFISISSLSNGYGRNHRNLVPGSKNSVCAIKGLSTNISLALRLNFSTLEMALPSEESLCNITIPLPSSNTNISESSHKSFPSDSTDHIDFL